MNFDYKHILIMGYAKSGKAVEEIVNTLGVKYKIYDVSHKINGGNYYSKLSRKKISEFDLIVISPGVSIYNKYVVMAERMGIKVVGELEFGYWFTDSPVIAITGTNGKTTTTSLINNIVSTTYLSGAYGNIGEPLCKAYKRKLDYLVVEVSSFQLESTYNFKPHISVILNIAEDHLDRHKNFENYVNCKIGLLKNCTEKSIVILNSDDKLLMQKTEAIKAKKYFISKYEKVRGVYVLNGKIYSNINGKAQEIMLVDEICEFGGIIENILASILVGVLLKIDKEKIIDQVKSFQLSPHRMQKFLTKSGVNFVDDSKSTNVHSTLNALNYYKENIILMLGGEDKKLNFDEIFIKYHEKIKYIVAFGSARKKVLQSAKKCSFENIKVAKTFYNAVNIAVKLSQAKDTILLSPACTSFDEFSNYAERGEKFKDIIKELVNAKN